VAGAAIQDRRLRRRLAWWVVAIVFFGGLGGSHRQPG